jgi:Cytochrome bd terminal oxidase subunit II/Cytochrome bd terminal oxidase subunit I
MIGIGLVLLAVAITGAVLRCRKRLFTARWFHLVCMAVVPLGFMAVLAGWTTTETGRQPFVVYGHLRTADALSPIAAPAVASSLAIFVVLYIALLLAFLWYGWRIVIHGPGPIGEISPNVIRPGLDRAGPAATGILFLIAPRNEDRDLMMEGISPFWDGNEVWLVLGGTLLLAAFPAGYYVLLPALYIPIMVMLFALILRGVAFEFRFHASHLRKVWDLAFSGGSLLATVSQGFVLGGFIQGIPMVNGAFAGQPLGF